MLYIEKAYCDQNGVLSVIDWSYHSASGGVLSGSHTCRLPAGETGINDLTYEDVLQILKDQLPNTEQEMEDYLEGQEFIIMNSRDKFECPHLTGPYPRRT